MREVGHPNTTFFCKLVVEGSQSTTQWNILNFRGVKGSQSILTVLPSTILSGTSSGGAGFSPTFRDMLTFPEYIQDLHGTTLTCGTPTLGLAYVMYFLYIYRKLSLCIVYTWPWTHNEHSVHSLFVGGCLPKFIAILYQNRCGRLCAHSVS